MVQMIKCETEEIDKGDGGFRIYGIRQADQISKEYVDIYVDDTDIAIDGLGFKRSHRSMVAMLIEKYNVEKYIAEAYQKDKNAPLLWLDLYPFAFGFRFEFGGDEE